MLFTCPADAARGGIRRVPQSGRQPFCIDVHCHVHYPPADEMVQHVATLDREPALRFANELSRATNGKQMENVRVCLTSVVKREPASPIRADPPGQDERFDELRRGRSPIGARRHRRPRLAR